jgi:RNA polymerase sigma-70 factor (ECF subfamily)
VAADERQPTAEELARQARDGSSAAFAALVDRFVDRLFRYLCQRVGSAHDAEDLAQETLLRAYRAIGRYDPQRSFAAWLFTIATRLAFSFLRRRRPAGELDAADIQDRRASPPDDSLARRERDENLWTVARRELTDDQFTVVWLHYVEDLPVRQVAEAMGKTSVHVKVLLHRGRRRLLNLGTLAAPDEVRGEVQNAE